MANRILTLIVALLAIFAFYFWRGFGAVRTTEEIVALERQLIESKCTNSELIDRTLLQQTWFYDNDYMQLAGAFGQFSFDMFGRDESEEGLVEGVFCIDGHNLLVQYVDRKFVPVSISISERSVKFGSKIVPLGEDTFLVRELTSERMILAFESDEKEHVFYRKN